MKAVLLGSGWRAQFYHRISYALPELLTISAVCTHDRERALALRKAGINAFSQIEEALAADHDTVIAAGSPALFAERMHFLMDRGESVISETSFLSLSDEENRAFLTMKGAVAEQYPFTPLYASVIASLPLIGKVSQLFVSGLHNHHAAAIARLILDLDDRMPDEILSRDFSSSITKTGARDRIIRTKEQEAYTRKLRILSFGDRLFISDFSTNQYHSALYGKRIEVRGEYGVITEEGIRCVNSEGDAVFLPFIFHRGHAAGNTTLTLSHVSAGERTVFTNPFYPAGLNDDEIGIALILSSYSQKRDCPTIRDGVLDARLGRLL